MKNREVYFTASLIMAFALLSAPNLHAADFLGRSLTNSDSAPIWVDRPGNGFLSSAHSLTFDAGASGGVAVFGGHSDHDFAIGSLSYGHMLTGVVGGNHWYRGNLELRGELFSGEQYHPRGDWVVGAAPHLRYDFATGWLLVPFLDVGAGLSATSIGPPDLGGAFEFNLQGAGGVHWFLTDHLALTAEARFMHLSSAGIEDPNVGVNTLFGLFGASWFF